MCVVCVCVCVCMCVFVEADAVMVVCSGLYWFLSNIDRFQNIFFLNVQ